MSADITVVVPTIASRAHLLRRALASIHAQSLQPAETITVVDEDRGGAAVTRQRGLEQVQTEWVAFLDDDDEMMPHHLTALRGTARAQPWSTVDLVYPWFTVVGGTDPLLVAGKTPLGRAFDETARQEILSGHNFIPVTVLARTQAVLDAGGFTPGPLEDLRLWQAMLQGGATFVHCPHRTWRWHHHGGNTSGLAQNAP